ALSTSILLDEQGNRRPMTVMGVSGSCRQFLCETASRLGVAASTHMLKGLRSKASGSRSAFNDFLTRFHRRRALFARRFSDDRLRRFSVLVAKRSTTCLSERGSSLI